MKRLLLTSIVAVICSVGFAQKFSAANSDGVNIKYEVISATNKTVQVVGGERPDVLVIPATVDNNGITYHVIAIKKRAYMPTTKLVHRIRRLVLSEGLIEIGERAFHTAFLSDGKETIYIPNSVKLIGKNAFAKTGFSGGAPRDCNVENLPAFVNEFNCENMGLAKECVTRYFAYHPRTNGNKQIETAYVGEHAQQSDAKQFLQNENLTPTTVIKSPSSDVDINIPSASSESELTFAVIFANEDYQEEVKVEYALNDGEIFKEYCNKVFGIPENNIHLRKNATKNNMVAEMSWMKKVADAYSGQAKFIVFYAGHGIPDEKTGSAYLLPVDGIGTEPETAYSLEQFYKTLGSLPVENVTVFMDACFSGSKRGEGMLASARGVAMKAKAQAPQGKMVVFSAAQGDETAYPFKEKEHGLFTYYLLKKLKDTKGNVTYGELSTYLQTEVKRKSIVANSKSQTPTVSASQSVANSWKNMKLK